jgi:hypothetical protein
MTWRALYLMAVLAAQLAVIGYVAAQPEAPLRPSRERFVADPRWCSHGIGAACAFIPTQC